MSMTQSQSHLPGRSSSGRGGEGQGDGGQEVNVANKERLYSTIGGGALAMYGLKRGGLGGALLLAIGGSLIYRGYTGHCAGYSALGINTADQGPAEPQAYFERGIHVEESVTINKTPWELYEYWKNFENLPNFMDHLKSVTKLDDKRSHWVAKAPAGMSVEWDAEIINDEPNALIAWRSLGGASVDNAGSVRFVPGPEGRGTEVKVVLDYIPPAGRFGMVVAKLFGEEPSQQVRDDLRHFKQIMETGERPTTEGQPSGRRSTLGRAAQAWNS
jgi:uncharacterized membrane protein